MTSIYENTLDFALQADDKDVLKAFRNRFFLPVDEHGKPLIYFCGNSLGLQPKTARHLIESEMQQWQNQAVEGHFNGSKPWLHYHKLSKEPLAHLTGALPSEVVAMNNLTTNLHLALVSFYRPSRRQYKILCESGAFPSDQYALESQVRFHGFLPDDAIIEMQSEPGELTLRTEKILQRIEEMKDELALVMFGGINYYTGQLFNMAAITSHCRALNIPIGFDLAHAIGNVTLQLHDWDVDFAVWCSYKYLNSSPGGVAGMFVHERHAQNPTLPRFAGWWGYDETQRFQMKKGFLPMPGADGWQLANAPILLMAAHLASLEIFEEAGMQNLRNKSEQLTGFLEFILRNHPVLQNKLKIITPGNTAERGCQLSVLIKENGRQVFERISRGGLVGDWREPDVIRLSPAPLYNTFEEVFRAGQLLAAALS